MRLGVRWLIIQTRAMRSFSWFNSFRKIPRKLIVSLFRQLNYFLILSEKHVFYANFSPPLKKAIFVAVNALRWPSSDKKFVTSCLSVAETKHLRFRYFSSCSRRWQADEFYQNLSTSRFKLFNGLFRSSKQVDPLKIMSFQKMILSSLESHVNGWKPLHDRDTIVNTTLEAIRQKLDKLKVNGKHASTFNETFW